MMEYLFMALVKVSTAGKHVHCLHSLPLNVTWFSPNSNNINTIQLLCFSLHEYKSELICGCQDIFYRNNISLR